MLQLTSHYSTLDLSYIIYLLIFHEHHYKQHELAGVCNEDSVFSGVRNQIFFLYSFNKATFQTVDKCKNYFKLLILSTFSQS
jgi:hypothetical protein